MRDIDLSAIRAKLEGTTGPTFWRSLDEVAQTPEFEAMLHREFPEGASEFNDAGGRREFLRLMSASLALAGAACTRQPTEHIVPYVKAPEDVVPGKPLFFATAMPFAGSATPVPTALARVIFPARAAAMSPGTPSAESGRKVRGSRKSSSMRR